MRACLVIFSILLCALVFLGSNCETTDYNTYDSPNYHPPTPEDNFPTDDDTDDYQHGDDDASGPAELPQWLSNRPYLQNRSLWGQDIDMDDPEWVRNLGCMGIGNGKVFGILGDQYPLGTWHNLGGPTYEMDLKWFTDKEPWLIVNNNYLEPTRQSIGRVRKTPVVIATHTNDRLEWTSVNFAPIGTPNELTEHALVSIWIVRNLGVTPVQDVYLEIDSNFGRYQSGSLIEQNYDGRWLSIRPLGVEPVAGDANNDMWIPFGTLAAGQEKVVVLPYVFTRGGEDPRAIFEAIRDTDVDTLLGATIRWWNEWFAGMTTIDTPSEKFNDLLYSLALAVKVNQAEQGGICQMSQYSHIWNRDTHGPTMYFPLLGLGEDVRDALDYHWGAVLQNGGLSNAYAADLDISNPPPPPDWDAMGVMGGFTRAEGPSTIVLQYENLYKANGDITVIEERWGMLKHALLKQQFVDGCLLHFSGDETFEDIMEVSFGENPLPDPDESVLSLYSSLLMIRASHFMADMAERLGYTDDADTFTQLIHDVEQCLEDTYWVAGRGLYAIKAQTDTREPFPYPYEDISTMPLWLDAMPRDDERVIENFETVMDLLGRRDGTIVSTLPWFYQLLLPHIGNAIQTGMSHAYWLNNLDKMFHPTADIAFERWQDVPTPAGFTDEGVIVTDYGHLQLIREPWGVVANVSARFRSWESGIMGHAFLFHLSGYDYSVPDGRVSLAPHLPRKWSDFALRALAYGDARFDLEVLREGRTGRRIILTTDADASFELSLVVPLDGEVSSVEINGNSLPGSQYEASTNNYGRTVVTFAPLDIPADAEVDIVITTVE